MSDRNWVKRILSGDKKAGERLVAEMYPCVFRMLRSLAGSADIADDLTQQTFVKAWQALGEFRGEAKLRTWIHRIAYREYMHWLRDKRECASLDSFGEIADPRSLDGLQTLQVDCALSRLTSELRDTFLLFHAGELSINEVAGVLGIPPGTVKSRLYTARRYLRDILSDDQVEERSLDPHFISS